MQYFFYFDIAALLIFPVVISLYFRQKPVAVLQNRAYLLFIFCAFATTALELLSMWFFKNPQRTPAALYWLVECLMYATTDILPQVYVMYVLGVVEYFDFKVKNNNRVLSFWVVAPYIGILFLLILSPVTYCLFDYPLVFYIDRTTNLYHRGGILRNYIYVAAVLYIVLTVYLFVRYKQKLVREKWSVFAFYIAVLAVVEIIQFFVPELLLQNFGFALISIMYSSMIKTPENLMDNTTQLFNLEAFDRRLGDSVQKKERFLVISLIIDDIAFISNTFGISTMNHILEMIADYLKEQYPHADIYYIPQEKFCLVFRDYDERDVEKIKTELKIRFRKSWMIDNNEIRLYARICFIHLPEDVGSVEEIHDILDLVSTESRYKKEEVYAKDIDMNLKKQNARIIHLIKMAILNINNPQPVAFAKFFVYYQPIYSVKEERLIGAEALIRLRDDNGSFVSPEEFIPISERSGDIIEIGKFVIESVCQDLSRIDVIDYGIKKIDINLSVVQCMQETLAEKIAQIIDFYKDKVPPSIINMEITETAAAHTPDILYKNMESLAEAGIELSLDDYGSGYSNMGYLLGLPFKMIKIDKNIVWTAFEDSKANIALAATIKMIKQLGMTVLAEGVETKEQVKWLSSLGCDFLQGYYFAKGLPADEYLSLMKSDYERYKKAVSSENQYLRELHDELSGLDNLEIL